MPTLRPPAPDGGQTITRRLDMAPASRAPHGPASRPRLDDGPRADRPRHRRHEMRPRVGASPLSPAPQAPRQPGVSSEVPYGIRANVAPSSPDSPDRLPQIRSV